MSGNTLPTAQGTEGLPPRMEAAGAANNADQQGPQFGIVDVVESFAALRQECRQQAKHSQTLNDTVQQTANDLIEVQQRLLVQTERMAATMVAAAEGPQRAQQAADADLKQLRESLMDIDTQLLRAVNAAERASSRQLRKQQVEAKQLQDHVSRLSWLGRWFAKPLIVYLQHQSPDAPESNAATDGLQMLADRVSRTLQGQGIERLDTLGQVFDAQTMHAIDTVASTEYKSGKVAEQSSPAYLADGKVLRYAQVRVSA